MKSYSASVCISAILVVVVLATMASAYNPNRQRKPNPRTCQEAELCCPGQNNTCFVFGRRMDRSSTISRRCYCDSNCAIMGDCCLDYPHYCQSVNCEVGEWGEWSKCDNPCGFGKMIRTRDVSKYPDNGGENCPVLKQRRACVGYVKQICLQNMLENQEEEKGEQGRILPIEFGRFRNMKEYNPWQGILKNLYLKHFNQLTPRATYRANFRITRSHYGCEDSKWADVLKVNTTVCVECQPVAMNKEAGMRCIGHGVLNTETAWKAVDVSHCHGKWVMLTKHEEEVCEYNIEDEDRRNFIFL